MTSRWHGKIGFGVTQEVRKGVWKNVIEERTYYGNISSVRKTSESQSYSTNDDLQINAKISVLLDGYLSLNCASIRYAEYMGALWKVKEVSPDTDRPRLFLTLGGVYASNSDE